jgi:hypothetical protein
MGYGEFTLDCVIAQFGLELVERPLFGNVQPIEPTPWLSDLLAKGRAIALYSEKSRSEFIVAPVLLACQEMVHAECCVYSGIRLDVDSQRGLSGPCDFVVARTPPTPILRAPLLVVVEAKKNDIEEGLGQCAAQMIAARLFNESRKVPLDLVYGCVTTGETWQFLRLREQQLVVDSDRYYLLQIATILGILLAIIRGTAP